MMRLLQLALDAEDFSEIQDQIAIEFSGQKVRPAFSCSKVVLGKNQ
jgi:hypothetical protein